MAMRNFSLFAHSREKFRTPSGQCIALYIYIGISLYEANAINFSIISFYFPGSNGYTQSSNAFIYSLRNNYGYGYFKKDVTYSSYATYSYYNYGPTFGAGHDIYLADNAGYNYYNYFSCQSYRSPYCSSYVWTGSYNFCPNNAEVYYEAFA